MYRYSEEEIRKGLQEEDHYIIRYIYKNYYSAIKSMMLEFNNHTLDPKDIFQEGIVRLILNIRNGRYMQQSSIYYYLHGICRNLCLKELKRTGNFTPLTNDIQDDTDIHDDFYKKLEKVLQIFSRLDHGCQEIINLRFGIDQTYSNNQKENKKNTKFEEIGSILNIRTDNARQRFRRCLEKLKGLVKRNSDIDI